jgi:hypothetical protein
VVFEPSAIVFHEHRRTYDELARQIYWHGLGLSAYLFRSLLHWPQQIPGFLGTCHAVSSTGSQQAQIRSDKKSAGFPPPPDASRMARGGRGTTGLPQRVAKARACARAKRPIAPGSLNVMLRRPDRGPFLCGLETHKP